MAKQPCVRGFTTQLSLMKAPRVSDYQPYARELVEAVPDRHISFEVFSDDIAEMVAQARASSALGCERAWPATPIEEGVRRFAAWYREFHAQN